MKKEILLIHQSLRGLPNLKLLLVLLAFLLASSLQTWYVLNNL